MKTKTLKLTMLSLLLLMANSFTVFAQAGLPGSQPKDIKVGVRPDGSQCFYCAPHEWRGCDTLGNSC